MSVAVAEPERKGKPPVTDAAAKRAKAEADLQQLLTGAVFTGTWQMTSFTPGKAQYPLTTPKPEKYTISKVERGADDYWIITSRIQYADKDVEVPVLVRVVWSGDTPVITVDDLAVPLIGTYSARVMIYRGFYAGTWFGKGYGGVLSGQITKPTKNGDDTAEDVPAGSGKVDRSPDES